MGADETTGRGERPWGWAARAGRKALMLVIELRAPFLLASAVPVAVGAAMAARDVGGMDWALLGWTLAGVLLLHAGANVINDYFDHRSGNDAGNSDFVRPFSGGSRMIQRGLLTPREVLGLSLSCFAAGAVAGAYLTCVRGLPVLLLGLAGAGAGFCYTAPGVNLAARGLGELAVGLTFGVLPLIGAYFVQAGRVSASTLWPGAALAILVSAILFVNQFPDFRADAATGKRNWVVRLGRRRAARVYAGMMMAWPAPLAAAVAVGDLPAPALYTLLALAPAAVAARRALRHYDDPRALSPANALTILVHHAVGLVLAVVLACASRSEGVEP